MSKLADQIEDDLEVLTDQIQKALQELDNGFIDSARCHLEYALSTLRGKG
jgi:hypothetical protein